MNVHWMNSQLYSVLSMKVTDTPLQILKAVKEMEGVRGAVAWHRMTREVAGRPGVRLERLADKAHSPKAITSYASALTQLRAWEQDCKDLAKIEGQEMAELTKRTTLKRMLPADLVRDLERDNSLKQWSTRWAFVLEQVPLRQDWKPATKKGINDMDIDLAEQTPGGTVDVPLCAPFEGESDLKHVEGGRQRRSFPGKLFLVP